MDRKKFSTKYSSKKNKDDYGEAGSSKGRGRGHGESSTSSSSSASLKHKESMAHSSKTSVPTDQRRDGREMLQENKPAFTTKPEHLVKKSVQLGPNSLELTTNYFKIDRTVNFEFTQYRVDFSPETDLTRERRILVAKCRHQCGGGYVYDGGNLIYFTRRLKTDALEVPLKDNNDKTWLVKFKYTNVTIQPTDSMACMVLNCILRNAMRGLDLKLIQRNLYDDKAQIQIPDFKLKLWPGYITSIRQHEHDILVCCEISHKVMRDETVYSLLQDFINDRDFRTNFAKEIIGTVVLTNYNKRTYRIDDVKFDMNPMSTFESNGKTTTFVEYYANRYNLTIKDHKQPLLISNPKSHDIRGGRNQPIALIPELCFMTGLTDKMRNNFHIMKQLGEYTRMDPNKRIQRLEEFTRRINQTEQCTKALKTFGVSLNRELVTVRGRVIQQEEIFFNDNRKFTCDSKADWTQGIIRNQMYRNVGLKNWGIVYPNRMQREFDDFWKIFQEVARGQRYEYEEPHKLVLPDDRLRTYSVNLEKFCARDLKFVMIFLPNNSTDRYINVKNITYVNRGIPSQVVVQRTIQPKRGSMAGVRSIATKILLQVNAKLGGVPWNIKIPLSGLMTIGFDVTHDTNNKSKSFGAFVASMDLRQNVSFFSTVAPHRNGEECSNNMAVHMQKALMAWRSEYGDLPERILMYRDGVGEGQIQYVYEFEVKNIKKVIDKMYSDQKPKFAFIVVSKRINTRFFQRAGQRRYENPNPGTVVDDVVTLPERYDFFLISQSVRQGTVSPTSYNVIVDTFGLTPERMQILTYKHCHLYFNWSGTIRVPAVVQYAHKLSIFVGQFLHEAPYAGLEKSLYYL